MNETNRDRKQGLSLLDDAIHGIPFPQKRAYLEALNRTPHLVEIESDPYQFLCFENFNAWAAAKRLMCYWEWRTQIFGGRAFRSIFDLTGNGALCLEDIECLRSGLLVHLPKDKEGNSVIFCDRSKYPLGEGSGIVPLRVFFYFHSRVCKEQHQEPEKAQLVGFLFVNSFDRKFWKKGQEAADIVRDAMPFRLKCLHLVIFRNEISHQEHQHQHQHQHHNIMELVIRPLINIYVMMIAYSRLILHLSCYTEKITLQATLKTHGFCEDGLPESIGGTWSYQRFFRVIHSQLQQQQQTQSALQQQSTSVSIQQQLDSIRKRKIQLQSLGSTTCCFQDTPHRIIHQNTNSWFETENSNKHQKRLQHHLNDTTDAVAETFKKKTTTDIDVTALARLLEDSIELMPFEKKRAYQEALCRCPELMKQESDPMEFLTFEQFDVWKTAQRLTSYWAWRRQIFEERAFLPILDFTGFGALDEEAIAFFKTGCLLTLPNVTSDGNLVAIIDKTKSIQFAYGADMDQNLRHRLLFCCLEIIRSQIRKQSIEGSRFGLIAYIPNDPRAIVSTKCWSGLLDEALPMSLQWVKIYVEPGKEKTWYKSLSTAAFKNFFYSDSGIYYSKTKDDLKERILSLGISEQSLPLSLGGKWSYGSYESWFQEQGFGFLGTLHDGIINQDASDRVNGRRTSGSETNFSVDDSFTNGDMDHIQDISLSENDDMDKSDLTPLSLAPEDIQHKSLLGALFQNRMPDSTNSVLTNVPVIKSNNRREQDDLFSDEELVDVLMPLYECDEKQYKMSRSIKDLDSVVGPLDIIDLEINAFSADQKHEILGDAIRQLPQTEKETLMEALRLAPAVVYSETNENIYFHLCGSDAIEAAKLYAKNWRTRQELFDERAFLPMNHTGFGALNEADIETFLTGFLMILPADKNGRCILSFDPARAARRPFKSQLRCFFYVLFLLVERSSAIGNGIAIFVFMRRKDVESIDDEVTISDVFHAFPITKSLSFHIIRDEAGIGQYSYEEQVDQKLQQLFRPRKTNAFHFHQLGETLHFRQVLLTHGIALKDLPVSMGGAWSDICFKAWQEAVLKHELSCSPQKSESNTNTYQ